MNGLVRRVTVRRLDRWSVFEVEGIGGMGNRFFWANFLNFPDVTTATKKNEGEVGGRSGEEGEVGGRSGKEEEEAQELSAVGKKEKRRREMVVAASKMVESEMERKARWAEERRSMENTNGLKGYSRDDMRVFWRKLFEGEKD